MTQAQRYNTKMNRILSGAIKSRKHGEWVCPNNNNQTALPDEQGNCSLCSATLEAGWPEQKGND